MSTENIAIFFASRRLTWNAINSLANKFFLRTVGIEIRKFEQFLQNYKVKIQNNSISNEEILMNFIKPIHF